MIYKFSKEKKEIYIPTHMASQLSAPTASQAALLLAAQTHPLLVKINFNIYLINIQVVCIVGIKYSLRITGISNYPTSCIIIGLTYTSIACKNQFRFLVSFHKIVW